MNDDRKKQLLKPAGSLFSSDVYQSYTASYTWWANQTAHLGLGFVATAIAMELISWLATYFWVAFLVYPLKEIRDIRLALIASQSPFPIKKCEIIADSVTDVIFVSLGVALAVFLPWPDVYLAVWFLLLVVATLWGWWRFHPEKRAFDKSGLPYLFRLGTYSAANWDYAKKPVCNFLKGNGPQHLILSGKPGDGRTTLAVAIGSEVTVGQKYIRYISAANELIEAGSHTQKESKLSESWSLNEADWVIIDNISAIPIDFKTVKHLKNKRCIWVTSTNETLLEQLEKQFGKIQTKSVDVSKLGYTKRSN